MHTINPVLAAAVIDQITEDRRDAAARAAATPRRPPFAGLRARLSARRGGSPPAAYRRRVPARARHA